MDSAVDSLSFPATRRIKKSSDFVTHLKARGSSVIRLTNDHFECKLVSNTLGTGLRFGVIVGKSKARRAVDRVLVKRIIREAARNSVPDFLSVQQKQGQDIDVTIRLIGDYKKFSSGKQLGSIKKELRESLDSILRKVLSRRKRVDNTET